MTLALVTGGAKRIGSEIVLGLAKQNIDIALHYNHSSLEAEDIQKKALAHGVKCEIFQADLSSYRQISRLIDAIYDDLGSIDLCINNAAVFINDDILNLDQDRLNQHLAINLKAPLFIAEEVVKTDSNQGDRLIINMLDNKIFSLNPDFASYTLSKFALYGATQMLAMRLKDKARVCGIAPSNVLVSGNQTQEDFQKGSRHNLLKKPISVKEIVDTIYFIWKTKSYNGQIVTIDGGQSLMKLPRDVAFLDYE